MKSQTFTTRGTSPLLMHNERLANPFDPITKAMKQVTGKRKKTEDDLLEIARLEWLGGIYHEDGIGVHLPGYNVFAALIEGGKLHKLGTAIKRAAIIEDDKIKVEHEGPADVTALYNDGAFIDIRSVKVGTSKIARCRPIFRKWQAKFTVLFDETGIQAGEIVQSLTDAGRMVGIGDYRPRFGRFEVLQ